MTEWTSGSQPGDQGQPELDEATHALLTSVLGDEAVWQPVPPDLAAQVSAGIAETTGRVTRLDQTRARRRPGRVLGVVLTAAAAAVVFAGGVFTGGLTDGDDEDGQVVQLAATELVPGASAEFTFRDTPSGLEIAGDFAGLPPAAPGTFYQAWLKGEAGVVAIGTFHLRDGADDVVLWSGVDTAAYPKMTVTLQQEGAGPASSGRVVLAGDVR